MRSLPFLALAAPLTLGLVACGSPDRVPAADETPDPTTSLGPIQKANFERLDRDQLRSEYGKIVAGLNVGEPLPTKQDMDFAWLDRDSDGKLSVAEFMLWTVGAEAAATTTPTDDQVNAAASQFFAHDLDGDVMLSEAEFAAASGRPAPTPSAGASEATDAAR